MQMAELGHRAPEDDDDVIGKEDDIVRGAALRDALRVLGVCGYMIASTFLYDIVTKLTFGTRDPGDLPDKWAVMALAQFGVAATFFVICARSGGASTTVATALSWRYFWCLLPYGVGQAL